MSPEFPEGESLRVGKGTLTAKNEATLPYQSDLLVHSPAVPLPGIALIFEAAIEFGTALGKMAGAMIICPMIALVFRPALAVIVMILTPWRGIPAVGGGIPVIVPFCPGIGSDPIHGQGSNRQSQENQTAQQLLHPRHLSECEFLLMTYSRGEQRFLADPEYVRAGQLSASQRSEKHLLSDDRFCSQVPPAVLRGIHPHGSFIPLGFSQKFPLVGRLRTAKLSHG